MSHNTDEHMREILKSAKVVAVVGHSDKPHRTSYRIAQYLRDVGYKVYPVNPTVDQINGQKSYASIRDIPEPVDIVDVFRRPQFLDSIVDDAIAAGSKVVWGQLGVVDEQAGQKAGDAGLAVVMDRCIMVEHRRLVRG